MQQPNQLRIQTSLDATVEEAVRFLADRGYLLNIHFTSNGAVALAAEIVYARGFSARPSREKSAAG